jgi:heme ABC exporter ATP-binding subunit CcmA
MHSDALIHVRDLRKRFAPALVLDGVTFDVAAGEAVALLGANGAGKTTLLKILATLTRPSRGRAVLAGFDCVSEPEGVRRNVGLIAHGAHVYEDLTALENLKFWTAFAGHAAHPDELHRALADVDLDGAADERVRSLSAGMKRRLGLARLSLARPRVLLLDEPFAGLDQRARKWLDTYLGALKSGGGAILMATHGFARDLEVLDRIMILAGGRVAVDMPKSGLGLDALQRLYTLHTEELP